MCEVFSVPRISDKAKELKLKGGWSLDCKAVCGVTGRKWDCLRPEDREWARKLVRRDKPKCLVLSPPCTLFSQLQHLSPNGLPWRRCPKEWKDALVMLEFAVELCEMQRDAGRGFLFEHPQTASSWGQVCLQRLAGKFDVFTATLDMCRFGMRARDKQGEGAVRKTTKLLTNVVEVPDAMSRRCEGGIGMFI